MLTYQAESLIVLSIVLLFVCLHKYLLAFLLVTVCHLSVHNCMFVWADLLDRELMIMTG
jgi:hypothetical protein